MTPENTLQHFSLKTQLKFSLNIIVINTCRRNIIGSVFPDSGRSLVIDQRTGNTNIGL
jgi:hypothetical protein